MREKEGAKTERDGVVSAGHAVDFLRACCSFVVRAKEAISDHRGLAMGCGVHYGRLHQVYLQGRFDYLGPPANKASKIQQLAWDEVCISPELYDLLEDNDLDLDALLGMPKRLADRGYRINPADMAEKN